VPFFSNDIHYPTYCYLLRAVQFYRLVRQHGNMVKELAVEFKGLRGFVRVNLGHLEGGSMQVSSLSRRYRCLWRTCRDHQLNEQQLQRSIYRNEFTATFGLDPKVEAQLSPINGEERPR